MVNNNPGVPPIHQDEFDEALYDVCQEIAFDLHLRLDFIYFIKANHDP